MTTAPAPEAIEFRAEIRQLLNILVHSLYTDREIFLRELVSNASDALNRIQFEMLTNRAVLDPEAELAIRIKSDSEAGTITISDTGIGMTREELIENLGTIAHSGAAAFLESLKEGQKVAELIGQFGVGFYSVFMVADEVRVTSRSHRPEGSAWTWTASGDESYTLEPAEKADRGTTIEIKLKEDAKEFAQPYRLEQIVGKHSDFVSFPIYVGEKTANHQTALWRQSTSEITDEAANDFYKQVTLDFEAPLARIHLNTDAPVQIYALLFIPAKADRGILSLRKDFGLKLYSRKILIQEYCKDLLPNYLRFVEGVVDSEDLPLNVSRETVQANKVMERIKGALTHKVIDSLKDLGAREPEKYREFWKQHGLFIKEGLASDYGARNKLTPLVRFYTSRGGGGENEIVSLAEYVGRMAPEQKEIYYILGEDLKSVAHSPHLDYFRKENLEVLYLVDPMDTFMLSGLPTYEGFPLKNVDDPNLELPKSSEEKEEAESDAISTAEFEGLIERFKAQLGERVTDVRASDRLVGSPMRLVSTDDPRLHEMDRVRRMMNKDFAIPKKIVEINRRHLLIKNLADLVAAGEQEAVVNQCIEQLYENGLLLEGLHPNPAEMVERIHTLMEAATRKSEV